MTFTVYNPEYYGICLNVEHLITHNIVLPIMILFLLYLFRYFVSICYYKTIKKYP